MKLLFEYPFQAKELFINRKSLKKSLFKSLLPSSAKLKIALLGGSTTSDIKQVIELMLLSAGIIAEFFESDYNRYAEIVLFESGPLWAFQPDIIYIHTTCRNINFCETSEINFQKYLNIWDSIKSNSNAIIVQNNFEELPIRTNGNLELSTASSAGKIVNELNSLFSAHVVGQRGFYLNDIKYLSTFVGTSNWFDAAYWNNYKIPYGTSYTPYVARSVFSIILAHLGKSKKCLVLDLDNTLWGGVIGDDGINGISIGEGNAQGEAYLDFQRYVKSLAVRGVLLAICSKNDFETAKEAFSHPDSVLKFSDFSSFQANWEPKTDGLRRIAQELNVGLDSLVFIDDNPVERDWVRKQLHMVSVPEIGSDVSNYSRHIDINGYFESAKILKEDIEKVSHYADNKKREASESQFETYNDFLLSLDMVSRIAIFDDQNIDRITQLVNKTSQFNLTGKHFSPHELIGRINSPSYLSFYGRLTDKFGDNGLVSVVSGSICDQTVSIDLWVMSCRVVKRGLEYAMFDQFVASSIKLDIENIVGVYIETNRNGLVGDLYARLGFKQTSKSEWLLTDIRNFTNTNAIIKVEL